MPACDRIVHGYSLDMPSSITRLAALDHERISRLVRRACTPGPSQQRWRDELVQLVRAHHQAEEAALSPDVIQAGGPDAVRGRAEMVRIDSAIGDTVAAVSRADVPSRELDDAGRTLQQLLSVHAQLLEQQVLQPLEQALPRKEIRRLGGAYEDHRNDALQHLGDGDLPRRFDLPRAELYELARRAGVEGRSSMSRRDLISELQRRKSVR